MSWPARKVHIVSTKELVTIGQRWEHKRSREVSTIKQVHRPDRQVRMTDGRMVGFHELRAYYRLLD
jgi:hypothetical protein